MSVTFLSENIWHEITAATKGRRGTAFIAVPYFGKAGRSLLPLRAGDTLVVNASEAAVKSGQTYPRALRRLLDDGVRLYTLANLHAKIYVLGATAFIGSANASSNSRDELEEAVVRVRDRALVRQAREHIQSLCTQPLLRRDLVRLAGQYRPPKRLGGATRGAKSKRPSSPRVFLAQISEGEIGEEFAPALNIGEQEANTRREQSDSTIDTIWRRDFPYRMGDTVIVVFKNAYGSSWVFPPAKVINRKVVLRRGRRLTLISLEAPNRPRRRLATLVKELSTGDRARLRKNARLPDDEFRARLLALL